MKNLRETSLSELKKMILEYKRELFNLRVQKVNSQLKNTAYVKIVRRSIARIKTIALEKYQENL